MEASGLVAKGAAGFDLSQTVVNSRFGGVLRVEQSHFVGLLPWSRPSEL